MQPSPTALPGPGLIVPIAILDAVLPGAAMRPVVAPTDQAAVTPAPGFRKGHRARYLLTRDRECDVNATGNSLPDRIA